METSKNNAGKGRPVLETSSIDSTITGAEVADIIKPTKPVEINFGDVVDQIEAKSVQAVKEGKFLVEVKGPFINIPETGFYQNTLGIGCTITVDNTITKLKYTYTV